MAEAEDNNLSAYVIGAIREAIEAGFEPHSRTRA
jgi:hypothetical protein